jgi:hypothetical protein
MDLLKAIGEALVYLLLVCVIGAIFMALTYCVMIPVLGMIAWIIICFMLVVAKFYFKWE